MVFLWTCQLCPSQVAQKVFLGLLKLRVGEVGVGLFYIQHTQSLVWRYQIRIQMFFCNLFLTKILELHIVNVFWFCQWRISPLISYWRQNHQLSCSGRAHWNCLWYLKFNLIVCIIPSLNNGERNFFRLSEIFLKFLVIGLLILSRRSVNAVSAADKTSFLKQNYPQSPDIFLFSWIPREKIGSFVISLLYFSNNQTN